MGMTSEQQLPLQKTEKSEWSIRKLFPFAAVTGAFAKTFINVFDVLLGFNLLILGVGELSNKDLSWFFYVLTVLLLIVAFAERHITDIKAESK
jgi:hypothetical protein